jgi:hypothetical protein
MTAREKKMLHTYLNARKEAEVVGQTMPAGEIVKEQAKIQNEINQLYNTPQKTKVTERKQMALAGRRDGLQEALKIMWADDLD